MPPAVAGGSSSCQSTHTDEPAHRPENASPTSDGGRNRVERHVLHNWENLFTFGRTSVQGSEARNPITRSRADGTAGGFSVPACGLLIPPDLLLVKLPPDYQPYLVTQPFESVRVARNGNLARLRYLAGLFAGSQFTLGE